MLVATAELIQNVEKIVRDARLKKKQFTEMNVVSDATKNPARSSSNYLGLRKKVAEKAHTSAERTAA